MGNITLDDVAEFNPEHTAIRRWYSGNSLGRDCMEENTRIDQTKIKL